MFQTTNQIVASAITVTITIITMMILQVHPQPLAAKVPACAADKDA